FGEPYSHELPAGVGWEEVPVGGTNMGCGRGAGTAAKHELVAHEFSVVFAHQARCRLEAWVADIRARSPLPHIAEHLLQPSSACKLRMKSTVLLQSALRRFGWNLGGRDFPLLFSRKPGAA